MRRLSRTRLIFTGLFATFFAIYLFIGLQPADAYENYEISGSLSIPAISLATDVTTSTINDHRLSVPSHIVGSFSRFPNWTLLVGHSSSVFNHLHETKIGDVIYYNGANYQITSVNTLEKSAIDMDELLIPDTDTDTIILMTCAGTLFDNGDATHRLIVTAKRS